MTETKPPVISGSAVVTGVVVLLVALMATVVALGIAIEDGAHAATLIGLVIPLVGLAVPGLLALVKLNDVQATVSKVAGHTTDLTNGMLDAKVRAAVADVMSEDVIDPEAREQIANDRARRDRINHKKGGTP